MNTLMYSGFVYRKDHTVVSRIMLSLGELFPGKVELFWGLVRLFPG